MVKIWWGKPGILNHVGSWQAAGIRLFFNCCCIHIGSGVTGRYIRYTLQFCPFESLSWAIYRAPTCKTRITWKCWDLTEFCVPICLVLKEEKLQIILQRLWDLWWSYRRRYHCLSVLQYPGRIKLCSTGIIDLNVSSFKHYLLISRQRSLSLLLEGECKT